MRLSNTACVNASPQAKAYKLSDGEGMYLLVSPKGGKYWRMDYRFAGKRKTLALGVYPTLSLKDARDMRAEARNQIAKGIDPAIQRKEEKLLKGLSRKNDFESVAREWHEKKSTEWSPRYADQVLSVLKRDFFPFIGREPLLEISALKLLAVLRKIEERGALDALQDARSYAGQIFRYGIATGRAERDIAADLKDAFKVHKPRHFASLSPDEFPKFLRTLHANKSPSMGWLGANLVLLTLTRTGEVRGARPEEFDLKNRLWAIPAERMKMRREHLVPLSDQAAALIGEILKHVSSDDYLFPGEGKSPFMSENTMLDVIYDLGFKGRTTVHGFRSTGSTILHESKKFRSLAIERQLAHVDRNSVRASYNRAEYLNERGEMMQWWADHLDFLRNQESEI